MAFAFSTKTIDIVVEAFITYCFSVNNYNKNFQSNVGALNKIVGSIFTVLDGCGRDLAPTVPEDRTKRIPNFVRFNFTFS